jgi:hypothetical protein
VLTSIMFALPIRASLKIHYSQELGQFNIFPLCNDDFQQYYSKYIWLDSTSAFLILCGSRELLFSGLRILLQISKSDIAFRA